MTDKLKCPFCGAELQTHTMTPGRTFICVNKGCPVDSVVMKRIVWQALVDGKKAQDALKKAQAGLYCGHCVKTAEASQRWSEAIFFAKNFIGHGINSDVANYSESNCRWALNEIDKILSGITSITKQE